MMVNAALSHALKTALKLSVIYVFTPQIGICSYHSFKRIDFPASCLIHDLKLDSHRLRLPVLDDAVTELGMVCSAHLMDVEEHTTVTYYVVAQIVDIMDSTIIPYIT